jgi:hypothetical protein
MEQRRRGSDRGGSAGRIHRCRHLRNDHLAREALAMSEENKARLAMSLLYQEVTQQQLRELTGDELLLLRDRLWRWYEQTDRERQLRRAQSR